MGFKLFLATVVFSVGLLANRQVSAESNNSLEENKQRICLKGTDFFSAISCAELESGILNKSDQEVVSGIEIVSLLDREGQEDFSHRNNHSYLEAEILVDYKNEKSEHFKCRVDLVGNKSLLPFFDKKMIFSNCRGVENKSIRFLPSNSYQEQSGIFFLLDIFDHWIR